MGFRITREHFGILPMPAPNWATSLRTMPPLVEECCSPIIDTERGIYHMEMEPNQDITGVESILWRGFVLPGHEACRLFSQNSLWQVEGAAVFIHEKQPVRLNYQIICDTAWQTLSAEVEGWLGKTAISIEIKTDPTHHWWLNGMEQP